jgi:hypothetical protein
MLGHDWGAAGARASRLSARLPGLGLAEILSDLRLLGVNLPLTGVNLPDWSLAGPIAKQKTSSCAIMTHLVKTVVMLAFGAMICLKSF